MGPNSLGDVISLVGRQDQRVEGERVVSHQR